MTAPRTTYVTTTIPYVNARPHLGFALELVQADVLARHRRHRGDSVRFLTGTDDNSLKNVLAAEAEGVPVQDFVDRNADAFAALRDPLALSFDDFIRTSRDPRHRVGVERLWRRCADSGDLYRKHYEGLYCVGCEQFYTPAELVGGRCAEHGTEPRPVAEENWFFRLSRYADQLHALITSGRLRIEPAVRRNEVLALIEGGLHDFSVSRSQTRARGWGIPVPDDPDQVVYVWWDALGNYVTSLGHGTDDPAYDRWWTGATRRSHLLGKGVVRFHAVFWVAFLLSAGLPLPTRVLEIPVLYRDPWTTETLMRFRDRHQNPVGTDIEFAAERHEGQRRGGDGASFLAQPLERFTPRTLTDAGAKWRVELDGQSSMRTVADYTSALPLDEGTAGTVEFRAFYRADSGAGSQHEVSRFVREDGEWFYVDGETYETWGTNVRALPKLRTSEPELRDFLDGILATVARETKHMSPEYIKDGNDVTPAWPELQGLAGRTSDFREGVAAFNEKRPARFTGA